TPLFEVEDLQILLRDTHHTGVDDAGDLLRLLLIGEDQLGAQALVQRTVAPGAGEDEGDGGQHVHPLQDPQHVGPAEGAVAVLFTHLAGTAGVPVLPAIITTAIASPLGASPEALAGAVLGAPRFAGL